MIRPTLTERRRAQTRSEIAQCALTLFARDGYENTTADAIAEESGVSLRTFYRYFSGKDEVLSPIVTGGTGRFVDRIAQRPADESLATAVQRAFEEMNRRPPSEIRTLIRVLTDVPVLRARWLGDLRTVEQALIPVVHQRASEPLSDEHARLTAAAIVTGLRVTLELSATAESAEAPLGAPLGDALGYLRDGAGL